MRLRRARMVSGETPAAAAESLHANPWAMRSTSARSAGVSVVPSMNRAANGVRISISIWAIVFLPGVSPVRGHVSPAACLRATWGFVHSPPSGRLSSA